VNFVFLRALQSLVVCFCKSSCHLKHRGKPKTPFLIKASGISDRISSRLELYPCFYDMALDLLQLNLNNSMVWQWWNAKSFSKYFS